MRLLGIETSCDDTSVALLKASDLEFTVLAEKTASQISIHKKYGGVVPEVAGRAHAENIFPVVEAVMEGQDKPNAIAVTAGPGLITGLVIGVEAAKALSYLWNVPLVRVNHLDGHAHSVLLGKNRALADEPRLQSGRYLGPGISTTTKPRRATVGIEFPALCLLVSGGHTELLLAADHGVYRKLGATRDDAAGECFDKVGKLLGFDYPGGPKISALARSGDPRAIPFPRPMLARPKRRQGLGEGRPKKDNVDFSFAGLKTAALYWLRDHGLAAIKTMPDLPAGVFGVRTGDPTRADFCASFEQAIVDVLVEKTCRAALVCQPKTIILGGGVSANQKLRAVLQTQLKNILPGTPFLIPEPAYSMDNGAMIATAGYFQARKKNFTEWIDIKADPNWEAE